MSLIRNAIDTAVADVMAEHPKFFTPRGIESARNILVRKIMAALRDGGEKPDAVPEATASAPKFIVVAADSREARAFVNLRHLAGATAPTPSGDGRVAIPAPAYCDAVFALADLPPPSAWLFLTDRDQMGAWFEFFRESLPDVARRVIAVGRNGASGILMPYPFPPNKSGKIYEAEAA